MFFGYFLYYVGKFRVICEEMARKKKENCRVLTKYNQRNIRSVDVLFASVSND